MMLIWQLDWIPLVWSDDAEHPWCGWTYLNGSLAFVQLHCIGGDRYLLSTE